ncbi:hypothetical protein V3C99_016014 [Haemonchus contortus]
MSLRESYVSRSCSRKRTLFGILLFIAALFIVFGFITDFPTWQTDGFFVFHAITRNFNQTADSGTTRPPIIPYQSSLHPVLQNSSQTAPSMTNRSTAISIALNQTSLQPLSGSNSQTTLSSTKPPSTTSNHLFSTPTTQNRGQIALPRANISSTVPSASFQPFSLQPLTPNSQAAPSSTEPPSTTSYHLSLAVSTPTSQNRSQTALPRANISSTALSASLQPTLKPLIGPNSQAAPSSTNPQSTASYQPTLQSLSQNSSQAPPQNRGQTAATVLQSAPQNSTQPTPRAADISSTLSYQSYSSSLPLSNMTGNYPSCSQRLKFVGRINVSMEEIPLQKLEEKFKYLKPGGHYIPDGCKPMNRVAIIIPFRDRESHLHILLNNMHPFLTKQMLDYSIIVVEQIANQTFNRAKLFNVGYVEANKMYDWQCYVFHDVDLLPEDDRNLHVCPDKNPRHMGAAVNKFNYKLFYEKIFGGSSALTKDQFDKTNGFSNRYWGWGGEDDDMYNRVIYAGYKVDRYNETVARYTMIKHEHEPKANPINPCRYKLLEHTKDDWKGDGLNSLKYKILNITSKPLFTHILVDLLEAEERASVEAKLCQ